VEIKVVNLFDIKSGKFDEYEVLFNDEPIARALVTKEEKIVIVPTKDRKMSTLWFTKRRLLESILTTAADDGYKRRILDPVAAYKTGNGITKCHPLAKVLEGMLDGKVRETSVIGEVTIHTPSKPSPIDTPKAVVRVGEEVIDVLNYEPVTLIKKFMKLKYRFYVPHEDLLKFARTGELE